MKRKKTIENYFSTSIYYKDLFSSAKAKACNKELTEEAYLIRDMDRKGSAWCKKNYPGGYTSYSSIPNLHQRSGNFIELEKAIRKHVYRYAAELKFDLGDRPLVMTDFWINIMPQRVMHSMHLHPLSVISGTYYVKTPKGCSAIQFEDPRLGLFMARPPLLSSKAEAEGLTIEYAAEAGKLVLFESWLRHQVASNPTVDERISVSFNYSWG